MYMDNHLTLETPGSTFACESNFVIGAGTNELETSAYIYVELNATCVERSISVSSSVSQLLNWQLTGDGGAVQIYAGVVLGCVYCCKA